LGREQVYVVDLSYVQICFLLKAEETTSLIDIIA